MKGSLSTIIGLTAPEVFPETLMGAPAMSAVKLYTRSRGQATVDVRCHDCHPPLNSTGTELAAGGFAPGTELLTTDGVGAV